MSEATAKTARLGFLYPGYAAEDDYPLLAQKTGTRAEVVHTSIKEDAHTVEALSEMGSLTRLLEGAKVLKEQSGVDLMDSVDSVDSVMWSSTSASFVLGWDGAKRQAEALEEALGVSASTTALAFINAAKALDVEIAAVAATYPEDIALLFEEFLGVGGVEVAQVRSRGIFTAAEVGTLGREEVLKLASENDHAAADALFMPDTALHSAAWIEEMEQALGKRVITANQATFWEAMRLAGAPLQQEGLGALFRL